MGRYASEPEGNFTPAPVGTHVARCFRIVDLGTQHGEYKGNPTRRNQIVISWELPEETIETDKGTIPLTASRFYTNSLSEKASLRQDLEAWRGRGFTDAELQKFDLESILGQPCMLTIISNDNGKTKVAGVTGLPKNMKCPEAVNPPFTFWLDEQLDHNKFDQISEGIQGIIKKSEEWKEIQGGNDISISRPPRTSPSEEWDDANPPF